MSILDLTFDKPKTIEELKAYCDRNGYDSYRTRFFVGVDYKEPKAFGIYKNEETGEFVVYKNKDNGARAIRYQGPDEAFAVSELYDRLQAEIDNQKSHYYGTGRTTYQSEYGGSYNNSDTDYLNRNSFSDESYSGDSDALGFGPVIKTVIIIVAIFALVLAISSSANGGRRSSSGSHYSSYYDNHRYDSYDSGWSSDNWDSGYTDWGSDW